MKIVYFIIKVKSKIIIFIYTKINKKIIKSYWNKLKVNFKSYLGKNTSLWNNCNFNGMNVSWWWKLTIWDNFHSWKNCQILTQNHNYDNWTKIPYDNTYIYKDVTIWDNVWFWNNVIVIPWIKISEGVIIWIWSVVTKDIPYCAIVGWNPAKILKYRDIEHYEKLKKEKKFN